MRRSSSSRSPGRGTSATRREMIWDRRTSRARRGRWRAVPACASRYSASGKSRGREWAGFSRSAQAASALRSSRSANTVRVVALAPLTENMPGGSATRPGDILRMRSGKTVEVDNTDAEGRLILADALSYAEKFRPDVLLDFATLTGAAIVALGHKCAGLMTPDDDLAQELLDAGSSTGERLWRLPLWDDYRENLK